MKAIRFFKKLSKKQIQCQVCQRHCLISDGGVGFCLSKKNQAGQLYDLLYGAITHYQLDPIEKKPLYHVFPGVSVLSLGSYGCNYRCKQCLNVHCSWGEPATSILEQLNQGKNPAKLVTPEEVIAAVQESQAPGIAFTYNEPTIWSEFVYNVAKLAKKAGLLTVFVTNGSWSKKTIDRLAPVIDAANIDFKGFSPKTYAKMGAFWGQILANTAYAYQKGIFLELTTLLIPTINDNEKEIKKMTQWIGDKLDPQIPWHLSQYDPFLVPDQEFRKLPFTSVEQLKKTAEIGRQQGLKHIYIWAPHDNYTQGNTFCPQCKSLLIKRLAWQPKIINLDTKTSKCKKCGTKILGIWTESEKNDKN
ncbi:AmmeMemoRadiSam system radical SAM enzyme [Patescibacteria group bacterium]|nr:AmmeMemoRadiSam system radical SAM enzyme [Patescibacteria group bacterium]